MKTFLAVHDVSTTVLHLECIWSCSNRKGRCPQDLDSASLCRCSDLSFYRLPVIMADNIKKKKILKTNMT